MSARDGLQSLPRVLPAVNRAAWVRRVLEAGVDGVEAGSMVSASRVPQMADTDRMAPLLSDLMNRVWVLSPNLKGMKRSAEAGFQNIVCIVSATETHSRANLGTSIAGAMAELGCMRRYASERGLRVRVSLSVAWGDRVEGPLSPESSAALAGKVRELGFPEITLCDTSGIAGPGQVASLIDAVGDDYPGEAVGLHLHDADGRWEGNLASAIERGVRRFEGSVGGIGGCPFLPGAAGNIDMEKLVGFLHGRGLTTGVDLARLALARRECMSELEAAPVLSD